MTSNEFDERLNDIILDLVHKGTMLRAGKTINAGMFPEGKKAIRQLFEEVIGENESPEEHDNPADVTAARHYNQFRRYVRSIIKEPTND